GLVRESRNDSGAGVAHGNDECSGVVGQGKGAGSCCAGILRRFGGGGRRSARGYRRRGEQGEMGDEGWSSRRGQEELILSGGVFRLLEVALSVALEQTGKKADRDCNQVEGPLHEKADKSTVETGRFHTNYWMAVESRRIHRRPLT